MLKAAQDFVDQSAAVTAKMGTSHPFLYLNFALSTQNPFCSYGKANVAFLRSMAKKYDPAGVFQRLVPGGFKIPASC